MGLDAGTSPPAPSYPNIDHSLPVVCTICGVQKRSHEFTRKMRNGRTKPECRTCIKARKHPIASKAFSPRYSVKERRSDLSRKATPSEQRLMAGFQLLWEGKGVLWEFQKPIGPFFADFAVPKAMLVIEVDGGYHLDTMQQHRDASRTRYLVDKGWTVARYTNEDVEQKLGWVIADISRHWGLIV